MLKADKIQNVTQEIYFMAVAMKSMPGVGFKG